MGAMPVGCYKEMSGIKEGVIMRFEFRMNLQKFNFCQRFGVFEGNLPHSIAFIISPHFIKNGERFALP